MRASQADLRQVMADVFGIDPEQIDDEASIDTIDVWDSHRHLSLVLALEERFGVSLTEQETVEILNVELIRAVLREHGVDLVV